MGADRLALEEEEQQQQVEEARGLASARVEVVAVVAADVVEDGEKEVEEEEEACQRVEVLRGVAEEEDPALWGVVVGASRQEEEEDHQPYLVEVPLVDQEASEAQVCKDSGMEEYHVEVQEVEACREVVPVVWRISGVHQEGVAGDTVPAVEVCWSLV